jgi:hypothetical protein
MIDISKYERERSEIEIEIEEYRDFGVSNELIGLIGFGFGE